MSVKPRPGFVLAEPVKDETVTGSGVYMPEQMKDKPAKAKVLAVGEDTENTDLSWCKVDQIIIHKRWNGTTIKDQGKEVVFIAAEDILGYYE